MAERTYWDYAEDDRNYLKDTYDDGYRRPAMASMGQNICERYLKHVISEYSDPETLDEEQTKERALRTHNLRILEDYIQGDMGVDVPDYLNDSLSKINGLYFTTRYPGDESFAASEQDIDNAYNAVEETRSYVLDVCHELENVLDQEYFQEQPQGSENSIQEWDDIEL